MKKWIPLMIAGGVAFMTVSPAWAGTETPYMPSAPAPSHTVENGWWSQFTLNTWLAGIDGEVGYRSLSTDVHAGIDDVLDNLDFAYMAHVEFGHGRWGIGLDGVYAKLSGGSDFHYGPLSGSASVELEQAFVTARVQYRAVESERYTLDLFAGARWTFLDADTNISASFHSSHPALRQFNRSDSRRFNFSEDWIDPVVGFRNIIGLNESWYLHLAGDIGGFGVASDLTWQAAGGVGYHFTSNISALIGYRALGVDYENDGFRMDTVNHGPFAALSFKF